MIGSGSRRDKLRVVSRTKGEPGALGASVTEAFGPTLRASVAELSASARARYQSLNVEVTHQVIFSGRPTIDYATTEWQWGAIRLQPIKGAMVPGSSSNWETKIGCRDVTDRRPAVVEGSGS